MQNTLRAMLALVPILLSGCGFGYSPTIEKLANKTTVTHKDLTKALSSCPECDRLKDLFIVDLHADSFLWGRSVRIGTTIGHVDLKRLREGGVDLQIFGVPSRTPFGLTQFDGGPRPGDPRFFDGNRTQRNLGGLRCTLENKNPDTARLLYGQTGRIVSTARDIAYEQAARFCKETAGTWDDQEATCAYLSPREFKKDHFFAVRTKQDLLALEAEIKRARESNEPQPVGAMLAVEGVHWIEAGASYQEVYEEIASLKRAGFRLVGLTHKFSNSLASSDEDCMPSYGLTATGRKAVRAVFDLDMILDVAHLSADSILSGRPVIADETTARNTPPNKPTKESVLSIANLPKYRGKRRMIMSHGAIRNAKCENYRNLPREHVAALLEARVPFGVIHWDLAFCLDLSTKPDPFPVSNWTYADRIEQAVVDTYWDAATNLGLNAETAIQSLAIGADLDGGVNAPYDVRGFLFLLKRMSEIPWCGSSNCQAAVARIAGENVREFLMESLEYSEGGTPSAREE